MFTGIIEEKGSLKYMDISGSSGSLMIKAKRVLENTRVGDSIAVNGVCLTVTSMNNEGFCADIMAQTVRVTSLGRLKPGDSVNLERAMAADGRFGGHIVAGHVDGLGTIADIKQEENAVWISIKAAPEILRLIVDKGSITIDGASLTAAYVDDSVFKVSIIPHTGEVTTIADKKVGDIVNLENDIVGKYVEKLMGLSVAKPADSDGNAGITMESLIEQGF